MRIFDNLTRPEYAAGRYLTAHVLSTEQNYRQQRFRFHQRFLHGSGVRCGLKVVPADNSSRPWAVQVCPGYALDCRGDEILVPEPALEDIRNHLWKRPLNQLSGRAYIRLCYVEERVRPVLANPPTCGCDDEPDYKPSRLRDGFRVDVLWPASVSANPGGFDPCLHQVAICPDCSDGPCIILASVTLPASEGDPIAASHIENW